ncbi:MAG: hypothetical protein R3F59_03785 [Myxococcota bacterium]
MTQARTVDNRVLGTSDGRPGQTLRLPHDNVLPGTLSLAVQESAAPDALLTTWTEVDSLDAAGPFDRVYALDAEAGVVTFGDGERGMIPPLVPRAGAVVALRYRHGGGLAGECAAGAIDQTAVQATGLQGVVNVVPARGGGDAEDLLHAELRARKELSTRHRAVTAEDFAWIASQTPTVRVGRAIVVPLRRPLCAACPEPPAPPGPPPLPPSSCVTCLPAVDARYALLPGTGVGTSACGPALPAVAGLDLTFEAPGVVSVVVVPDAGADPLPPGTELLPTPSMLRAVCGWLDQHRLVTTEVHVVPPQYCRLCDVYVRVRPRPGYSRVRLQELVLDSLATWLDVLVGGPDGQGAAFGGQLHVADLIARVFRTEGVDGVEELTASFARTRSQASPRTGRLVRCPAQAGEVDRIALAPDETTSLDATTFTLATA